MTTANTSGTFAVLPLAQIVTSLTNPRKTFDHARLAELAESIKASGVHQPVLVRPLPASRVQDTSHMDPRPTFELVSGERRYRASEQAGLKDIPAMVRALTDDQVLEIQLVENLQRDDLLPMEEAEGYDTLMTAHEPPLSAEDIGARIGKSRSYVYSRLALLRLGTDGREALRLGQITAAHALLIARIPSTSVQAQALGNIRNAMTGELMGVREASALIQRQYMLRLAEARFKIADPDLVPKAGACKDCSKRTGADPDLFADVKGADVCTDPPCFKAKTEAHQAQQLKAARDSGAPIIEGREAKALTSSPTADGRIEGYLRLDDPRDAPKGDKPLRALIGKLMDSEGIKPTLIADPASEGELIACLDTATATRLLAQKGHQEQVDALQAKASTSAKAAEELQQQQDAERFENAWRWRVMERAWAKIRDREEGMYSVPPAVIWNLAIERVPTSKAKAERLCDFLGLGKVGPIDALKNWIDEQDDKDRALALMLLFEAVTRSSDDDKMSFLAHIVTDRGCGIDATAIRAEVEAEHRAEIAARKTAKASLPLPPAAQAERGAGEGKAKPKGKGKKAPAAPAVPKTSEAEARTGIAAAMQGDEGRATSPDAGASDAGTDDREA